MVTFDPLDYAVQDDPYPTYQLLRDEAPAYWNDDHGFWALSRHDDVRAALHDPATFSSGSGVTLEDAGEFIGLSLITSDPPRHTALRGLVSRAFTPRRIADLQPYVRDIARERVAELVEGGEADVMASLAKPLPTFVISDLLGVGVDDRLQLLAWSDALLHREPGTEAWTDEGMVAAQSLYKYFVDLVAERRRRPGSDLLSAACDAEIDGERLRDEEIFAFAYLLFVAGNETTTSLIGNGIYYLWANPDQLALLRGDPSLMSHTVEELLRYDAPTQGLYRTLTTDIDRHGRHLEAGQKVNLLFGSANRDERAFDDPDRFDIRRESQHHLAFGHGIHFCLGAALARMEAQIALSEFLDQVGTWDVEADTADRVHSGNQRGFNRLTVAVTSA
jgi:cytochrome P450